MGQSDGGGSSRSLGASSTSSSTFPAALYAAPEPAAPPPAFGTPKKQPFGGAGAPGAGDESPVSTPAALARPPRGGLLAGFRSIFRRKSTDASAAGGATPGGHRVAKLDDDGAKAYYDETLKRWVFPGETEEEAAPLAPPPTSVQSTAAAPQPSFPGGGAPAGEGAEGGAGGGGLRVPAVRPGGAKFAAHLAFNR